MTKQTTVFFVIALITLLSCSQYASGTYMISGHWILSDIVLPEPRIEGTMTYMPSIDKVLLFGGATSSGGDFLTWIFDPNAEKWSSFDFDGPVARYGHSMVYLPKIDKVLMVGGLSSENVALSDTWLFDPQTNTWKEIDAGFNSLGIHGSLTYDTQEAKAFYFGGVNRDVDHATSNKLLEFDLDLLQWGEVQTKNKPPARYSHVLQYDPSSNYIILYGGIGHEFEEYADTWLYNVDTQHWKQLDVNEAPNSYGRYTWYTGMASTYVEELDETIFLNDYNIWTLDIGKQRWSNLNAIGLGDYQRMEMGDQLVYIESTTSLLQFSGLINLTTLNSSQYELQLTDTSFPSSISPGKSPDVSTSYQTPAFGFIITATVVFLVIPIMRRRSKKLWL